jgi:hypothetical protein
LTVKVCPATLMVPERAAPVFACTLNDTEPLPLPLAPAVTVIQAALLVAAHVHPPPAVTLTDPEPAAADTETLLELSVYVQLASPDPWFTVKVRPATATVPERGAPVFGCTAYETEPFPLPVAPDAIEIHAWLLAAVHVHPSWAVTANWSLPAAALASRLAGRISYRQGEACCDTRTRSSLTAMSPSRATDRGLDAARNVTWPVPCPDVGANSEIQLTCVDALHAHSGCVVTVTVPVPPLASMLGDAVSAT